MLAVSRAVVALITVLAGTEPVHAECSSRQIEEGCSEGQFVEINGISLYYEVRGQGEPLLLLHGGGGSAEGFNPILPEWTQYFRVITPDSRAQGRSSDTSEPLSYRLMVSDMIGLLDQMQIKSAYVGGHSDGASIALHMAIYHPERVRALLLGAGDLSVDGLSGSFWDATANMKFPERLETWWKTRSRPTDDELRSIRAPTLFVIGKREPFVKRDHLAWQYGMIPDAEVVWLPNVGHNALARPDALKAFLGFIND